MSAKAIPEQRACLICESAFLAGGTGNKKRSQVYCSWDCRSKAKINTNGRLARLLSNTEAAYLAGVIDADGHVALYGHRSKGGAATRWRPHLSVANVDREALQWIADLTGVGSVTAQHKETDRRRASWTWSCVSGGASSVLAQTVPFMLIKRERADLVIDFWCRLQLPELKADHAWQQELRDQMLQLNRTGPRKETSE